MSTSGRTLGLALLLIGVIAAAMPMPALALGTPANTDIVNQATIDYTVNGAAQTQLFSCVQGKAWAACAKTSANAADMTTFKVDRKINFTVVRTEVGDAKNVAPAGKAAFGYHIHNSGNSTVSFRFTPAVTDTGSILTDEASPAILVDTANAGNYSAAFAAYDPATDTVAADGDLYVIVVNTVENLAVNGQTAMVTALTVQAADTAGAALVAGGTAGSGTALAFADTGNDNSETLTANRTWTCQSAVISISKASAVISDPVCTALGTCGTPGVPKAIPGAAIRYTISIANNGSASAILTNVLDTLDNNMTIVATAAAASWAVPAATRAITSGTLTADNNAADGLSHPGGVGGLLTAAFGTILAADAGNGYAAGELKPTETVSLVYDATIN